MKVKFISQATSNQRVPVTCPSGFQGRYTVQPGDTMFFIAQTFGVSMTTLIAANPHIPNPNRIFPGDILCVPGVPEIVVPCVVLLSPRPGLPPDALGSALVHLLSAGLRSVSLLAVNLPPPATFGGYDAYAGMVELPAPESGAFVFPLHPTPPLPQQPLTWAGTIVFPRLPGFPAFTAGVRVSVHPYLLSSGADGPAVLANALSRCCR